MALCDPCHAEYMRWLDMPMVPRGIRIHTIGDSNPRNVVDANRARAADHYALIRRQRDLITEHCRRDHPTQFANAGHVARPTTVLARQEVAKPKSVPVAPDLNDQLVADEDGMVTLQTTGGRL